MPHNLMVTEAVASYKATINEAVALAQKFTLSELFTLNFNTRDLSEDWTTKQFEKVRTGHAKADKRKCVIYTFTLVDDFPSTDIWEAVAGDKTLRKTDKKKNNLCATNEAHTSSKVLYVGRSFAPRSRLAQHLNDSDGGTYAMHLEQWAMPFELDIELKVYDIPEYRYIPHLERAMNVLETGLWDHHEPLLGRRGDK